MAFRALTDQERESLKNDPNFKINCEWAARNYADYWSSHDGSGLSDETARVKWAKDRKLGVDVYLYDINDSDIAAKCSRVIKNLQVNLDSAPQTPDVINTALLAASQFESIASMYFDLKGEVLNYYTNRN